MWAIWFCDLPKIRFIEGSGFMGCHVETIKTDNYIKSLKKWEKLAWRNKMHRRDYKTF